MEFIHLLIINIAFLHMECYVMKNKELLCDNKQADSYLLVQGYVDGKLVATHQVKPTRRASKI